MTVLSRRFCAGGPPQRRSGHRHQGQPEALDRFAFKIKLHQDGRLRAHNPAIMARRDGHHLRGHLLFYGPTGVLNRQLPAGQKAHVGLPAQWRTHLRLPIVRPAKAGRVDHALHPGVAGAHDVDLNPADFAVRGALERAQQ